MNLNASFDQVQVTQMDTSFINQSNNNQKVYDDDCFNEEPIQIEEIE